MDDAAISAVLSGVLSIAFAPAAGANPGVWERLRAADQPSAARFVSVAGKWVDLIEAP